MTKEELIELVRLRVRPVVDETNFAHEVWVEKVMATVYAELLSAYDFNAVNTRYFTKDFELTVTQDSVTDIYFSNYPDDTTLVYINDAAGAVRFLAPKKQRDLVFVPILDTELELMQRLNTNLVDTRIKYITGRNSIQYDGITPDLITEGVLARLVIGFDSYEYTDQIYIPEDQQKTFVNEVVTFFAGEQDVDLSNNNNPG